MKQFAAAFIAIWSILLLAACESNAQYDGVSRFAGAYGPYYGPGSPPREISPNPAPAASELPG